MSKYGFNQPVDDQQALYDRLRQRADPTIHDMLTDFAQAHGQGPVHFDPGSNSWRAAGNLHLQVRLQPSLFDGLPLVSVQVASSARLATAEKQQLANVLSQQTPYSASVGGDRDSIVQTADPTWKSRSKK